MGLPCVVPKTEDLPEDPDDGPNDPDNFNKRVQDKDKVCDPDVMNQIYSKSFLEATRENIMAETIIRKPDSIMEYTCFDQLVKMDGDFAGPVFSETDHWREMVVESITGYIGPVEIDPSCEDPTDAGPPYDDSTGRCSRVVIATYMNRGRLLFDLRRFVLAALRRYIMDNFGHTLLGGQLEDDYVACDLNYVCNYMNTVWTASKCGDMNDWEEFYKFADLADTSTVPEENEGFDPRVLPRACTIPENPPKEPPPDPPPAPRGTGIMEDIINLSENVPDWMYVNVNLQDANHIELLFPDGAELPDGTIVNCEDIEPVPTGIWVVKQPITIDNFGNVTRETPIEFYEKVCINPGCSYNYTTERCAALIE